LSKDGWEPVEEMPEELKDCETEDLEDTTIDIKII